jgi:uncharacterized small protein (TIGR04563 family)
MNENTLKLPKSDKRTRSLNLPKVMLEQIRDEANRQDRSLSYIIQRAVKHAFSEIRKLPSANHSEPREPEMEDKPSGPFPAPPAGLPEVVLPRGGRPEEPVAPTKPAFPKPTRRRKNRKPLMPGKPPRRQKPLRRR